MFCLSTFALAQGMNVEEPETQAIDHVWSGHRVMFDFVSQGNHQMVAYYDAARQMSIAVRTLGDINGGPWQYQKLPSFLGWDAHNNVEAAFDKNGIIHVVGNLHANAMVYFRSTKPFDPRTLVKIEVMVRASDEARSTYPSFFNGPDGSLNFKYRDGTSANGRWFYNRWDPVLGAWKRLHETVLLDGEGKRGVYPDGPTAGPDGFAHMAFVWRSTSRASSNHSLSYARSRDLVNWETSSGTAIKLPITLESGEIIDPVPEGAGLLNGRTPVSFDANGRVLVTYQKYDANGQTQVFIVRRSDKGWVSQQISNWKNSRVELDKSGGLDLTVDTSIPATVNAAGQVVVQARWHGIHWEWVLDSKTFAVVSGGPVQDKLPTQITRYDADNGIPQHVIPMMVEQQSASTEYYLSWEAMPPNRDQARADIPPLSTLRVHYVRKTDQSR